MDALPRRVAQLPDGRRRHESGPQQAVLQQLGEPPAVLDIVVGSVAADSPEQAATRGATGSP
jgi:hypothetical protein